MTARWVDMGSQFDLEAGPLAAEIDGYAIAVVRVGQRVHAYEDRCTHDGETLAGAEIEDCAVVCPRHGARFSLTTGEPSGPPAYEPIRIFGVREADGRILVEIPD